jgi:UDPglucose--hexose-1-phosphate uridylyltransferase
MSEFRQDPVTGRWVIITSGRASRPWHINTATEREQNEPCPFCAGNESMTPPEVWAQRNASTEANAPDWRVRVILNKYPALEESGGKHDDNHSFYRSAHGLGVHEVIIESPRHVVNMSALGVTEFATILGAYRARLKALKNDRRWRYLLIYKNHGARAGATFEHIHSQLVALPFVPREAQDEIDGARKHFDATGRCVYCEMIERESARGERLVWNSARFIAFCPFAPRFGYETWILPKDHTSSFEQSSDQDLTALADCLRLYLLKLNGVVDHAPFNYVIHSAPTEASSRQRYHWHMEILPQITRAAGFEWGTGAHMNSIAPEDAARLLRDGAL